MRSRSRLNVFDFLDGGSEDAVVEDVDALPTDGVGDGADALPAWPSMRSLSVSACASLVGPANSPFDGGGH